MVWVPGCRHTPPRDFAWCWLTPWLTTCGSRDPATCASFLSDNLDTLAVNLGVGRLWVSRSLGVAGTTTLWGGGTRPLRLPGVWSPCPISTSTRSFSLQPAGPQKVPCSRGLELVVVAHPLVCPPPQRISGLRGWPKLVWRPWPPSHLSCVWRRGEGGAWSKEGTPWEGAPPLLVLLAAVGS